MSPPGANPCHTLGHPFCPPSPAPAVLALLHWNFWGLFLHKIPPRSQRRKEGSKNRKKKHSDGSFFHNEGLSYREKHDSVLQKTNSIVGSTPGHILMKPLEFLGKGPCRNPCFQRRPRTGRPQTPSGNPPLREKTLAKVKKSNWSTAFTSHFPSRQGYSPGLTISYRHSQQVTASTV